ncbi:MAG: energy-coupling factor transporter transmembrane protein EcfT [Clostridiales bacterium]|jgi:energy-coupling factor transport system permease protein|nr:energy-coupling factor transporter transmembrane protein EcfT [Clostridiales bacterium]
MRDATFGQYYPSNSVVHKIDPRLKILMVIAYITMVFEVPNFWGFLVVSVFVLFATIISRVPIGSVLRSVRPIMYLIIFTSVITVIFYTDKTSVPDWIWWKFNFYKKSIYNAAFMACRLLLLVLGPSILTLTTTPVQLTDGLEWLFAPLKLVKFPVHTMVLIMSIALRFIPTLMEETDKIINAQKARCANFDSKNIFKKAKAMLPVLIPLFVSSFKRADQLAEALDSRCYNGAKGRTRMKKLQFGIIDLMGALFFVVFFLSILILKYQWIFF